MPEVWRRAQRPVWLQPWEGNEEMRDVGSEVTEQWSLGLGVRVRTLASFLSERGSHYRSDVWSVMAC